MSSSKTPATTAARKEESHRNQWWYPLRCELPGCESTGNLLRCLGCCMVKYCCEEHQREDWAAHKQECKVFKRLGLRATFYTDEEVLARYPLQPPLKGGAGRQSEAPRRPPAGTPCPLCLRAPPEVAIRVSPCCGRFMCDEDDSWFGGISSQYCFKCHDRYTHCGKQVAH